LRCCSYKSALYCIIRAGSAAVALVYYKFDTTVRPHRCLNCCHLISQSLIKLAIFGKFATSYSVARTGPQTKNLTKVQFKPLAGPTAVTLLFHTALLMLRLVVCSAALCGCAHSFAVPAGAARTSNAFSALKRHHPASSVILNAAPPTQQTEQELRSKVS
jgi:hypothetical protein